MIEPLVPRSGQLVGLLLLSLLAFALVAIFAAALVVDWRHKARTPRGLELRADSCQAHERRGDRFKDEGPGPAVASSGRGYQVNERTWEGIRNAFGRAHLAVKTLGQADSLPATTLVLALSTPEALYLAYVGDGGIYLTDGNGGAARSLLFPQHNGGNLSAALGLLSYESSGPVMMRLPRAQLPDLVVVLSSDGAAHPGKNRPIEACSHDLLVRLAACHGKSPGDAEDVLGECLAGADLELDNRTICVMIDPPRQQSTSRGLNAKFPDLLIGATNRGPRVRNEDAYAVREAGPYRLACIADGVGSHANGHQASLAAVDAVVCWFREEFSDWKCGTS